MMEMEHVGDVIIAEDETAFLIITDGEKFTFLNLDICELNGHWYDSYEAMMEDFNDDDLKAAEIITISEWIKRRNL